MNWVLMIVLAILLIGMLVGLIRGGLRIAVSLVSALLTLGIVCFVSPYVSEAIIELTPVDEIMESYCENIITAAMTGDRGKEHLSEEQVRSILRGAGVTEADLEAQGITVEMIVNGEVDGNDLTAFGISKHILNGHVSDSSNEGFSIFSIDIPREEQIAAIEKSILPDVFKEILLSNNNNEVYEKLGAVTFGDYIGKSFAHLVISICSFILTFVVATLVIRAIVFALDIVTTLPGLGFLNRMAGVVLGTGISVLVIDAFFVVGTLLYMSSFGEMMLEMVRNNAFLSFLYDNNIIMNMMMKIY